MTYRYTYVTKAVFSPQVEWHFIKCRAVPCSNEFQQTEDERLVVTPSLQLFCSQDGQGNQVQWGSTSQAHDALQVLSEGIVHQSVPYCLHEQPAPYYLTPTRLTTCVEASRQVQQVITNLGISQATPPTEADCFRLAESLMHLVYSHVAYTPGYTTTATTAAQVWNNPHGVCQDYAHLLIALCRLARVHARYVNGLIEGEGETHAWVEVSDGSQWLPFDPTHDVLPQWGYVKIAHGRDADDCPTFRGRIYGRTLEQQQVWCSLSVQK